MTPTFPSGCIRAEKRCKAVSFVDFAPFLLRVVTCCQVGKRFGYLGIPLDKTSIIPSKAKKTFQLLPSLRVGPIFQSRHLVLVNVDSTSIKHITKIFNKKLHFYGDSFRPLSSRCLSTFTSRVSCFSKVSENTIKSSRNTSTSFKCKSPTHFSIRC